MGGAQTVTTLPVHSLPREVQKARKARSPLDSDVCGPACQESGQVPWNLSTSLRKAWNEETATLDDRVHHLKCWRTSHGWDQTCARFPRARERERERGRRTMTTDGSAPSLLCRGHGAYAVGTIPRPLPRVAVLRGLHGSEFSL